MKTLILALALLCIGSFSSDAQSNYILGNKFVPEKPIQELDEIISHYTLFTADINKNNFKIDGTNNEIILDLGTQKYNFNLYDNNLVLRYESVANPMLLGGSMNFGGIVSLTINHNFIYGYIRYGETMLFIEPVRHFDNTAPDNLFVIYNAAYVIQSDEHICGVTKSEEKTNEFRLKMPTTMCNIVDFALANTYDMVTALGTVTDVENHNLAVLNNVQTNYRSEFDTNLEFELVDHFIPANAGADPFSATTNANTLLSEFSTWGAGGNNNGGASGGFGVDYHRASLWTDRDIASGGNSGVVGLAQTPGGHNLLENYSSSAGSLMSLQSHEIGHNFDAVSSSGTFHDPPTSATIMAPSVVITPDWSTASQSDISTHIATMTYLDDCSTLSAPNADFFQSALSVCPTNDIEFEDQSQYGATRSWEFFGGTPMTGTAEKETITFNTAGLWANKIVSSNATGQDSSYQYVDIQAEPTINCTPNNPGGSGPFAGITFFTIENISNSSPGSSSSTDYENNICSQTVILEENTSYDFGISVGDCTANPIIFERIRIYIDYNGDGDFDDSGESAFYSGGTSYCGFRTDTFTTDANPTLATMLRMRVISDNGAINSPCHDPSSGEVEDYGVYFEDSQVFGCTDSAANNYDPNATVDDGSCTFGGSTWYADTDSDTFGDPNNTTTSGSQPSGYVADNTDCDDTDSTIYPGAPELCDGQINNCNTGTLPADEDDNDGDNYVECTIDAGGWDGPPTILGGDDCNDNDALINPGAVEICDGIDNNCDGQIDEGVTTTYYRDDDGDSFGDLNVTIDACSPPNGYVTNSLDCNDNDNTVYPTAPELCDGQINNCNLSTIPSNEVDNDGDNYVECTIDAGGWDGPPSVLGGDDCDDSDANNYPGNTEVCDGADNDCDGQVDEGLATTYYRDFDGDTFGDINTATMACSPPTGYVTDNTDCDDNDANNYPGNTEVCDGSDNDCDGQVDEGLTTTYYRDFDGDTFGDINTTTNACSPPAGYVTDNTDCDDNDANNYPGNTEVCDGSDNDCDGFVDESCQPCDGDILVINVITQNAYHAEISITSDALLNNGQNIGFFAGDEITLDANFEVVLGTTFDAIIQDCIPVTMVQDPGTQLLNSTDIDHLNDNIKKLTGNGEIEISIHDRWGNVKDQKTSMRDDIGSTIDEMIYQLEEGIFVIVLRQADTVLAQQIAITK